MSDIQSMHDCEVRIETILWLEAAVIGSARHNALEEFVECLPISDETPHDKRMLQEFPWARRFLREGEITVDDLYDLLGDNLLKGFAVHAATPVFSPYKGGDVVKVRRNQAVGHFPAELIVLVAVPPHFSPDDAIADLLGKPRQLMKRVGSRQITYIMCQENDQGIYHCPEKQLLPSGKEPIEIGTVTAAP